MNRGAAASLRLFTRVFFFLSGVHAKRHQDIPVYAEQCDRRYTPCGLISNMYRANDIATALNCAKFYSRNQSERIINFIGIDHVLSGEKFFNFFFLPTIVWESRMCPRACDQFCPAPFSPVWRDAGGMFVENDDIVSAKDFINFYQFHLPPAAGPPAIKGGIVIILNRTHYQPYH